MTTRSGPSAPPVKSHRIFWALLSMTICVSSLSFSVDPNRPSLAPLLEQLTAQGNIVLGALLLGSLAAMAWPGGRGRHSRGVVSAAAVWYLVFELGFSALYLASGNMQRGVVGPCLFLLTFAVFGMGLPRFIRDADSIDPLFKMVAWAVILMLALVFYQLFRDPEAIFRSSRLCGLTGNPQLFASYCVVFMFPMICFCLRTPSYYWKLICLVLSGILALSVIMCGSRTGLIMIVAGLGVMFRKTGKAYLLLPLLCIIMMVGWSVLQTEESSSMIEDRFGEYPTENTRQEAWSMMWEVFIENPLFGDIESVTESESSYLGALSRFGLIGTMPLIISMMLIAGTVGRLYRIRSKLGGDVALVDLVAAGFVAMALGAVTEGFLMATRTPILYMIYVYFAIISYLLNRAGTTNAAAGRRVGRR